MKRLMSFKSLNEAIHNESLVIHEIKKMFSDISKITPLKKDNLDSVNNIEKEKREKHTNEFHFILQRIDPKFQSKIEKIMNKYQSFMFPKIDIIMKYKINKNRDVDLGDDFNIIPLDTHTISFNIFLKNIHTERIVPPRFVFHCSDTINRYNIEKQGLEPKNDKTSTTWQLHPDVAYPPAVFATIKGLWNSYGDVWIIDTKGLSNKWWYDLYFRKGDNKIMTFDSIPPNHLHLVESYDDEEENDLQKRVESTVKKLSKNKKQQ